MEFWNRKYYNEALETMPRDALQQLQFKRFKNIFAYAYEHSPAYSALYKEHGISPDDLKNFEDLRRVPIVNKEFVTRTLDDSVYGSALSVDPAEIVFYHQTSGTTSSPVPQPDTRTDWYYNGECWAYALWAHGLRPGDKALIAFNYNLFIGFWQAHYGCEKVGVEIVPGGSLSSEVKLQKIKDLDITVLITTPSYAFRLAEAAEGLGYDMRGSTIKKVIISGEPGGLVEGVKDKLEAMWDAEVFDNIGATEIGAWGFECDHHGGGTHILEPYIMPELIDFETGEAITEPGKHGLLVFTNFFRKARPCIRFNTNDIACWSEEQCACGRTLRMIKGGIQGRFDHILKVRGTFINPVIIEDVVNKFEKCSQEYQIVIHEDNKTITLTVEAAHGISAGEYESIEKELGKRIKNATFVRLDIVIVPYGSMARSDSKSKRVTDLRKKEAPAWNTQK